MGNPSNCSLLAYLIIRQRLQKHKESTCCATLILVTKGGIRQLKLFVLIKLSHPLL